MPLFLLLILVPLIEAILLLKVMSFVGFWATLALILLTATLGFAMAKKEGLKVLKEIQESSQAGKVPKEPMLEALMILIAGIMLLFPGLISDTIGFCMLFRPLRKKIIQTVQKTLKSKGFKEDTVEYEIID